MIRAIWQSTVGKKYVMAVTGAVLLAFVVGHMLGNLQVYLPNAPKRLNDYAHLLRSNMALLWSVRLVLLACVLLHLVAALQLWLRNRAARPEPYAYRDWREASYAARTMILSGPIILFFVVYHILHFTTGHAHPDFREDVYRNFVRGFQDWYASGAYIVAQILLGLHIAHGAWSMFQSVGINHPRYNPLLRGFALLFAVVITAGNVSMPIAVLAGLVR